MLKIRLRRMGSRHRPFYRVVVSDSRRTPTASAVEEIGYYDPRKEPSVVSIDLERVDYWKSRGAQLSNTVRKLVSQAASAPQEPAETESGTPPEPATTAEAATEAVTQEEAPAAGEAAEGEAAEGAAAEGTGAEGATEPESAEQVAESADGKEEPAAEEEPVAAEEAKATA